jgi:hypothetical protein
MLALVGLSETYVHDGRVLIDQLDAWAVPQALRAHRETLRRLGEVYKQLNAPFGQFGMDTLMASTSALKSGSDTNDQRYTQIEQQIESLTAQRDALASQMKTQLDAAAFDDQAINEREAKRLIEQGEALLERAHELGDE